MPAATDDGVATRAPAAATGSAAPSDGSISSTALSSSWRASLDDEWRGWAREQAIRLERAH
jgi:hypothetical protein